MNCKTVFRTALIYVLLITCRKKQETIYGKYFGTFKARVNNTMCHDNVLLALGDSIYECRGDQNNCFHGGIGEFYPIAEGTIHFEEQDYPNDPNTPDGTLAGDYNYTLQDGNLKLHRNSIYSDVLIEYVLVKLED